LKGRLKQALRARRPKRHTFSVCNYVRTHKRQPCVLGWWPDLGKKEILKGCSIVLHSHRAGQLGET
jgi:hypothetical protein